MNYRLKPKNFLWKLTFPFAHSNFTVIGRTIYHPKGRLPGRRVLNHELIHMKTQESVGLIKYLFLYLFCGPFLYNPWRYKWEMEAFTKGHGLSESKAREIVKSYKYGWLLNG